MSDASENTIEPFGFNQDLQDGILRWLDAIGTPPSQWGMEFYKGPETEDFEITVDSTDRFTVGKGSWGIHGPTKVIEIIDDTRMIVRPMRSFLDMVKS